MSWMRSLTPAELTETTLRLVTQPGQRQVMGFLTDARKDQIAQVVQSVLGRRVRIEVAAPKPTGEDAGTSDGQVTEPQAPSSSAQRREALSLPLVKHVVDLFDATLTDVRTESKPEEEGNKDDV